MPYKDKEVAREYNTEYMRRWRANHKTIGLCRDCNKPVIPGYALCAAHLLSQQLWYRTHKDDPGFKVKAMEYGAKARMIYKETGRCNRCGGPLTEDDDGNYCNVCRINRHSAVPIPYKRGVYRG